MENNGNSEAKRRGLSGIIDSIEGDKVIWIIVLLLILFSVLAIFSSTATLSAESRIDIMKGHVGIAMLGLGVIFIMYKYIHWIAFYRVLSQLGFIVSFVLLLMLVLHVDLGSIRAVGINNAYRILEVGGFQIHVFEVVKVAMVMYLAWALHSVKQDSEAMEAGVRSGTLRLANRIGSFKNFEFIRNPFWKRVLYVYLPALTICGMIAPGSNSSALIVGLILLATMIIGGVPYKEVFLAGIAFIVTAGILAGIHLATDGRFMPRLETFFNRMEAKYDTDELKKLKPGTTEFFTALDAIRQPYGAKIAIHEGGPVGKGSGNSTQRYSVTHIYSDYMFSFIVEEYGLLGGIIIIILYVSLLARSAMIVRLCKNEFAKIAVGGLALLISGQAFLHMMVNVDIGPMTGQTLPLLSDGACAFLVFCGAFGIILSISRMTKKKIQSMEESSLNTADDIQERITILEQIEDENFIS